MGRFDDLDQHLARQAALNAMGHDTVRANVEEMSRELMPIIEAGFSVVDEYYREILSPRTDLVVVVKKEEKPGDFTRREPHYQYVVNYIHKGEQPDPMRGGTHTDYFVPREVSGFDWHPNVALQVRGSIQNKYDFDQKAVAGLEAQFNISVWGVPQGEPGGLISRAVVLDTSNSFDRNYTRVTITGDKYNPNATATNIQQSLMVVSPHVLEHMDVIRNGRYNYSPRRK